MAKIERLSEESGIIEPDPSYVVQLGLQRHGQVLQEPPGSVHRHYQD